MKSVNPSTVKQGTDLIVSRAFTYMGVAYTVGVKFPYETLKVPWNKVRAMMLQKKLVPINTPHLADYIKKKGGILQHDVAPLPKGMKMRKKSEPKGKPSPPKQEEAEEVELPVEEEEEDKEEKKVVRKRSRK